MNKFSPPKRLAKYQNQDNIWNEVMQLITQHKPVDLGQGYQDYLPPDTLLNAFTEFSQNQSESSFQYSRARGHPRLVHAIAAIYSKLVGRTIDPLNEIVVSFGAYSALLSCLLGFIETGDEVVIIEPFYPGYERAVLTAGGVPKFIPLKLKSGVENPTSADWILEIEQLETLFNHKTKILILNNPHNPTGKIFSQTELGVLANLCKKWNVLCISDEVYEFIVYEPNQLTRFANLPEMWERTITVCSFGKSLGATGMKLGFSYGPSNLMANVSLGAVSCFRNVSTVLQEIAAICLEKENQRLGQEHSYFSSVADDLKTKRDFIYRVLTSIGLKVTLPESGYFIVVDWSPFENLINSRTKKDDLKEVRLIKFLVTDVGIVGPSLTTFYSNENKSLGQNLIRFCFCKKESSLENARQKLEKWKNRNL